MTRVLAQLNTLDLIIQVNTSQGADIASKETHIRDLNGADSNSE